MTNTHIAISSVQFANTDDLPAPEAYSSEFISNNISSGQQSGAIPDVADSGRIGFGACARLPVTTALPRPNGPMPSIADSGRVGFGACARLPASK